MANSEEPSSRNRGVLTWRQSLVLQAIEDYVAEHGCSPSNRDIAKAAGLKSPSSVLHHLQGLRAAGLVSYDRKTPRTVRVVRPPGRAARPAGDTGATSADAGPLPAPGPGTSGSRQVVWVPVVGRVAAGQPIPPLESIEDRIPLPREVVGAQEGLFILKIEGDSMTGVGIFPGDWVVVRELPDEPKDGDIVAAWLNGIEVEGTVKTYMKVGRHIWLMPQNSAYTPIAGDKAKIGGKVVAVLRWLPQRVRTPGMHPVA
jgi:repressor LexA